MAKGTRRVVPRPSRRRWRRRAHHGGTTQVKTGPMNPQAPTAAGVIRKTVGREQVRQIMLRQRPPDAPAALPDLGRDMAR